MIEYLRRHLGRDVALKINRARLERWAKEETATRRSRREKLDEQRRARGMHVRDYGSPPPEVVTVNHHLACLRAAYWFAQEAKMIRMVPFKLRLARAENALRAFFEADEWDRVRSELRNPPDCARDDRGRVVKGNGGTPDPHARAKGQLYADFSHAGYVTGARREDVEQMHWSQVDRTAGELRLWDTKNGEPRLLPLEGELADIVERRWKAREWTDKAKVTQISPLVFHFEGREVGDFRKAWRAACLRAGVVGKKPFHDFRRSAARNMVRAGTPQRVAQQITGHKTAAMFDRYNIVSTEDMRAAMRRTAAYVEREREERSSKVAAIRGRD